MKIEKFKFEIDIEEQTTGRFVMGVFADDDLIGIGAFVLDDENSGNIYQMYIKEKFQRKNIGYGLIQGIINKAGSMFNYYEIYLEVTTNNSNAYNLYKKFGFEKMADNAAKKKNKSNLLMKIC